MTHHEKLSRIESIDHQGRLFRAYGATGVESGGYTSTFTYESQDRLTEAKSYAFGASVVLYDRYFDTALDNAGNRLWMREFFDHENNETTYFADESGSGNLGANSVDQVRHIKGHNRAVITGSAPNLDGSYAVTVNGLTPFRPEGGDFFVRQIAAGDGTENLAGDAAVGWFHSTTPADAVTASQPFFIPAKERPQTYDANGNLTSDGVFTYEWDADGARPRGDGTTLSCPKDESGRVPSGRTLSQDRLVTIEHTTSQPKFRKKFRYDYMSRRVEERYFTKAGSLWFPEYTRRYIYDGYTMVAELDVSHSGTVTTVTTRRTFAWGHETAGGGIGALLLVDDHPNDRAYYPGYDGRGSVTLLVDADTGEKVAGMEYDVWGKLVRATGEWRATPFLYDTKWS
ncbi:MAG: hypothetical protein JJU00_19955, partial [Opitutales bacterium]|nr:hypothetical protein [Opitutales bacterium]